MKKLFFLGAILLMAISCNPENAKEDYNNEFSLDKDEIHDDDI